MPKLTEKEQVARQRSCLALDFETTEEAMRVAMAQVPYFGVFKIGKELHSAACNEGVPIVHEVYHLNYTADPNVFLDLKLHDTPNTVYKAVMTGIVPGVRFIDLHVAGGEEMCKKAVEAAYKRADELRIPRPEVIGVTVLTSLSDEDLEAQGLGISYDSLVKRRTELALEWGLDGIVCPAKKAGAIEAEFGDHFTKITPGIKWKGKQREGQKQVYTPDQAVREANNSILVLGGAVTTAEDPIATAYEIIQAMAANLR